MKTLAVAQARMGSTRFPGKVLKPLSGIPILAWVVRALRMAPGIDQIVIATSTLEADDAIVRWCKENHVACFRGSESDVLDRFYRCAVEYDADVVLRLTCDCPFLDPSVIGQVIQLRAMTRADYCTNQPTWPDGLDVECFTFNALSMAWKEAVRETDRDCVTQWIFRNADRFQAEHLICPFPGAHKERWVLDTEKDYELCKEIAARLERSSPPSCTDIMRILDKEPKLREINHGAIRNERFYEGLAGEPLAPRSFTRSNALLHHAKKVTPYGSQTFSKSYLHFPAGASPLFVTHGDGARIFDVDGNDYVDLVSALLPVVLGYRDPDVDEAVRRQLSRGMSFSLATELEIELAEKLCELIPCAESVRFGKSGTDVTTAAVRLARAYTGRVHVLVGGYHGWADWSVATMGDKSIGIPESVKGLSHKLDFIDGDIPENPKAIAAIIVEPMDDRERLQKLREFCSQHGIILIFDEIKTGFRYAMGGAQELFGITPDLACFGKAMGNGMPISAVVGRKEIMNQDIFYSGTFFGDTLSLAAALATIKKMEKEMVVAHLWTIGREIQEGILDTYDRISHPVDVEGHVIKFQGLPPLLQISFHDHVNATKEQIKSIFLQEMAQQGVLVLSEHGVSFAHKEPEVQRIVKAYDHTMGVIHDCLNHQGEITKRLKGMIQAKPVRAA